MYDCFESVRLIQRYYNRTGIFQMDYSQSAENRRKNVTYFGYAYVTQWF